jgi:hypothetical protein
VARICFKLLRLAKAKTSENFVRWHGLGIRAKQRHHPGQTFVISRIDGGLETVAVCSEQAMPEAAGTGGR